MKSIIKTFGLVAALGCVISCDQNASVNPNPTFSNPTSNSANYLFINATADGPSLDLYVNGLKGSTQANGTGQSGYTAVPIQTGFSGSNSIANASIRAKTSDGSAIGGSLGANDVIFRSSNTGVGSLTATPNGLYTVIALDSTKRPIPARTFSINAITQAPAADLTYYYRANGSQISLDAYKALSATEQAKAVSLGTIPAGCTDPGGLRFLLLTDAFPVFAPTNTTLSGIRFVNGVANAYSTPTNTRIYARLKPTAGSVTNVPLATNAEYIMGVPGGFTPSAGNRSAGIAFITPATASSATTPFTYSLELSTDNFTTVAYSLPNLTFAVGKVYTVVARGLAGKTGASGLSAVVVQHN